MATAKETLTPQTALLEPEKIMPRQRLRRALADPDTLDEFFVNPQEVAQRYDVPLSDEEITTIRNASHFLASWDLFCGEGQWLDSVRFDGRMTSNPFTIADLVLEQIRGRIGEEIVRETPRAIRRVVTEIGGEALVDPQDSVENLPEYVQPLARTLRSLFRTLSREVIREVRREMIQASAYPFQGRPTYQQPTVQQPVTATTGMMPVSGTTDGITALSEALGRQLQELVNHAAQEAVEHMRPQVAAPQRRWQGPVAQKTQPTKAGKA
jgi:hypothetical protein